MTVYVSAELRRLIVRRAGNCCEYCLLSQNDVGFSFHFEHIVSIKHDGKTESDNLCLSCPTCNRYKGTDIAATDPQTGEATFLFNPRLQHWSDHFRLSGAVIETLTAQGRVTVFLLRLNNTERILERLVLFESGHYPCHQD